MSRSSRRGPWLPEEDASLLHLVRTQGLNNWVRISQHMQHRSPKQCRERYHQNLKPSLSHEPISAQEGEVIEQLVQEMGKRWAEIARRLGNRSDNAVKNWWNGSMNRRKRNTAQQNGGSKMVGYRTQPIPASAPSRQLCLPDQTASTREAYGAPYSIPPPFHKPELTPNHSGFTGTQHFNPEPGYRVHHQTERPRFLGHAHFKSSSYSTYDPSANNTRPTLSPGFGSHQVRKPSLPEQPSWPGARSAERRDWQLPPLNFEPPVPSPAATEISHTSSNQQAPSLVSDNQSNCSISPKTIPSPRPRMPATSAPTVQLLSDMSGRSSTGHFTEGKIDGTEQRRDDVYMQTCSPVGSAELSPSNVVALPGLLHHLALPEPATSLSESNRLEDRAHRIQQPPKMDILGGRDARMNVARLIE
ncbi:uncharacterized protein Z518_09578 [Rhinocladiella mackenziei CBS 650.93]|uniref:MYB family conidiophore development protein FlbD n=1 Tax=Rhinocladiella mackenziei CBS 650.93 TaxID=1442369 RepID=A0A0D2IF14_9EURO|nr:uncharacterized protein Z518_09578 [Rhinocladiella mackenziei CBS 650.93]KIX01851.1 hypothetical protein Z518_09578 [Rhinocladiella mackenziei CBS 650.93]